MRKMLLGAGVLAMAFAGTAMAQVPVQGQGGGGGPPSTTEPGGQPRVLLVVPGQQGGGGGLQGQVAVPVQGMAGAQDDGQGGPPGDDRGERGMGDHGMMRRGEFWRAHRMMMGRGASFHFRRGDAEVDVRCSPAQPLRECVEAAVVLMDRLRATADGAGSSGGSSGPTPGSTSGPTSGQTPGTTPGPTR